MACEPILKITDGTTTVNLLDSLSGFLIKNWRQSLPQPKGGGVWQSSNFESGRSLIMRVNENIIDTMTISVRSKNSDSVIRYLRELYQLLEKATEYWTSTWNHSPVWIVARAPNETNTRYATINDYRIPSDASAMEQPFFTPAHAIPDFQLTLEHGYWTNIEPGSGACVEISEGGNLSSGIEFNGATTLINCGSDASVDDLPLADFTAEAWMNPSTLGELDVGKVFSKGAGWRLGVFNSIAFGNGVSAWIDGGGGGDASTGVGIGALNVWHHLAMTWDFSEHRLNLFIDGYLLDTATATVGYVGDSGSALIIGNNASATNSFEGKIGWARISDNIRYSTTFTPPPLCEPPPIDTSTIALWHLNEGYGTTARNYSGTVNTGTITAGTWSPMDCGGYSYDTCENEIFVHNTNVNARLTDIYINDGGAWSVNLVNHEDYDLLPDPYNTNDAIYFGISSVGAYVPFQNLVFDFAVSATGGTLVWEFWDGAAWQAIPAWALTDNTDDGGAGPLTRIDVKAVSWEAYGLEGTSPAWGPGATWTTGSLFTILGGSAPAITGWWIRLRASSATGQTPAPAQQNRRVYTVMWNNVEVDSDAIGGDIPALARIMVMSNFMFDLDNQGTHLVRQGRVMCGLRSVSRGANFVSMIPITNQGGGAYGITFTNPGAWTNYITYVANRAAYYSPTGADKTGETVIQIHFGQEVVRDFYGTYRIFAIGGVGGTEPELYEIYYSVRLEDVSGDYYIDVDSDKRSVFYPTLLVGADPIVERLTDLGTIVLPPPNTVYNPNASTDTMQDMSIIIKVDTGTLAAAVVPVTLSNIVLIPVDEWAIDTVTASMWAGDTFSFLDIDSALIPKEMLRAIERNYYKTVTGGSYSHSATGPAILQSNSKQRLHFFVHPVLPTEGSTARWAYSTSQSPNYLSTVQIEAVQRYMSMRGDS